jgi:hypothetical protein
MPLKKLKEGRKIKKKKNFPLTLTEAILMTFSAVMFQVEVFLVVMPCIIKVTGKVVTML